MTATTPSQTVGPFFGIGMVDANVLVAANDPRAIRIDGGVLDGAGAAVPDAVVEIFDPVVGFGRAVTDSDGHYHFVTLKPPANGESPHFDVSVFARGLLQRVATRLYFPDEAAANDTDPLLMSIADDAVRATLVATAVQGGVRFDVHLQGPEETAFFEL